MTSPIRDIDAARRALVAERRAFQIAIGLAFWWVHTPQGDEFWSGEYEAGRLSPEGRTALEAMIAEYEAEHGEEAGAPVPTPPADDPVKAEHTPGPWDYVPSTEHHGPYITNAFGTTIADFYVITDPNSNGAVFRGETAALPIHFMAEMAEPNARLCAAAPEMLAALKEAQEWLYRAVPRASLETEGRARLQRIDAAIKRAEGRS